MTPAIVEAQRAGIWHSVHEYTHDPAAGSYGAEAAAKLGVAEDRVFKTLVAQAGKRLVVAVVPVPTTVNLKALAAAVDEKRADMADVTLAERTTGYVAGGISPLGQRKRLTTIIDETATLHETIFVSAGRRGLEIELAPDDLARLCGAQFADIAK